MSYQILSATTATITALKRSPMGILKAGNGSAVAILHRNKPVFYCVPPDLFAYYVELAEDAALNRIVDERMTSIECVNVSLDDL
ncbi:MULTISPECIES: type II toxin-antitoxin system Phd/YefM family antitoxin [Aeromonas]|uniref:type II toxin-antitoxin system Phd/YefM family antitoxin n=1 Tax=Aeromonas TaxID=642 RepID=UPI001C2397F0|nr:MULTISPECIES: plasmid stabilization protein [Aeromonas]EJN6957800.1 plasmid stabilization protein [Aeromonas hydrophila]MCX0445895.1 plasmid stabilization protein [Aeromonas veronii]MDO2950412.1 plasmid stabilization protein [Aeromonas simiae]MDO2953992.1 plasmid stabilization protein [Aeromonas simiae]MDO2957831.1 plasmid stabilization protein [Aeromonas simiae]